MRYFFALNIKAYQISRLPNAVSDTVLWNCEQNPAENGLLKWKIRQITYLIQCLGFRHMSVALIGRAVIEWPWRLLENYQHYRLVPDLIVTQQPSLVTSRRRCRRLCRGVGNQPNNIACIYDRAFFNVSITFFIIWSIYQCKYGLTFSCTTRH